VNGRNVEIAIYIASPLKSGRMERFCQKTSSCYSLVNERMGKSHKRHYATL
jgi:hypothetical protein